MSSPKNKLDIQILFKGFVFIVFFYIFFTIVYFLSKPVKERPVFIYFGILIYLIAIITIGIEILRNIKKDKRFLLVMFLLALIFFIKLRATQGIIPYRDFVYTFSSKIVSQNYGYLYTIRFFGMTILIKLSLILFQQITWKSFTYLSSLISFFGLIAVYLISKKIYKKTTLSILPILLVLLNFWVLLYLGNEEFSGFAVSFLMIAYYFMLERKPLNALIAFMAAAFSRSEVFLLFPFFIAQYWYVNNIDFRIKKELKKIKKLPPSKIIFSLILIILLCIESWVFVTNLVDFYSFTNTLELSGPQPREHKAIFNYLYYHFTYKIGSRIFSNLSFLVTQSFLQRTSKLGSAIIFILFVISSLLGLKDKRIQIFLFNIMFFFVLYAIIRYDGFINGKFRYTIFIVYLIAIITPYALKVLMQKRFKYLVKTIYILIAVFLIVAIIVQVKNMNGFSPYAPFTEKELKQIYSNLSDKCRVAFISEKHPMLLYRTPSNLEIIPFYTSNAYSYSMIQTLKSKDECLYVIIPTTARITTAINFYDQAINENWCTNEIECYIKLNNRIEVLEQLNFTKILSFNKSKSDLGGIYYWENGTTNR